MDLTADMTSRALAKRQVEPGQVKGLILGWTNLQPDICYRARQL